MTITTTTEAHDWRTGGACDAFDADLHYADADELVEEQGFTTSEAREFVSEAETLAKWTCARCPIRLACLDNAMTNKEEYGIWGGRTVGEREMYRPVWAKLRKAAGRAVVPTVQKDLSALHHHPPTDHSYRRRAAQAQEALDALMVLPSAWTLDTRKWLGEAHYGDHPRQTFVDLFDLIRLHPQAKNEDLARGLGKSKSWFNSLTRSCRKELGLTP
jgi:WhiB family redox-sensing transcriptional regulator